MPQTTAATLYSEDQVSTALNCACDDILDAADAADEGGRDALNLLVNAALTYLRNPQATLEDVAQENYDKPLSEILEWIGEL